MRTVFWSIVYALACAAELFVGWMKDHAEDQIKGKKKDREKEE